jgi:ATP-binding cassette subfamily B multidrug efflux pump
MSPPFKLLFEVIKTRFWARALILTTSLIAAFLGLFAPYFQKEFIDTITQQHSERLPHLISTAQPLWLIVAAFFSLLAAQGFIQLTNYLGYREALIMQRILADRLYNKMLSLRIDTMSQRPIGEVVSIYATDVPGATVFLEQTLPTGASTVFPLLLAPFAVAWAFGISIWPTVITMIVVTAVNTIMAFRQSTFFLNFKRLAAERIGLVNEWVQNIRTIRILSWVPYFEKQIFLVRETETENRVKMVTNGQVMNAISTTVTFALNVVTLASLVFYSGQILTPGEMMALLWILTVFLVRPFRQMPWFFTFAFDSWTSLKRLSQFLEVQGESKTSADSAVTQPKPHESTTALAVEGLNLRIDNKQILKDIHFKVRTGEFVAVVGEVGAGKSMLLLSLLRETAAKFKKYEILGENALSMSQDDVRRKFSFVPQEGFIMSASLRENVAFLYDTPTDADPDIVESLRLAQFDLQTEDIFHGLETEIGERGVNLSGGQKQRVSLARVHFLKTSILLLDDCLSALDVNTEEQLLESLLNGAWKNRTRILVTHRLSVLKHVDRILFMSHGQIIQSGTFHELLESSAQFRTYTKTIQKEAVDETL